MHWVEFLKAVISNALVAAEASVATHWPSVTLASGWKQVAFSPDGGHILSGSSNEDAYIWQVQLFSIFIFCFATFKQ
jgi:hypothetical protein